MSVLYPILQRLRFLELAEAICPSGSDRKVVAVLKAYFDETKISPRDRITAIAGFIADADEWDKFEIRWSELLDDFRVPYVHISEMRMQINSFSSISRDTISDIERRAANIVDECDIYPIYAAISCSDWEAMYGDGVEQFRAAYPHPFFLAFEDCIQRVIFYARRLNDRAAVIFSLQDKFSNGANYIYSGYANSPMQNELGPLVFDNMRRVLPLQGADVFASEIVSYWEAIEHEADRLSAWFDRPINNVLVKKNRLNRGGLYTEDGLKYALNKHLACGRI